MIALRPMRWLILALLLNACPEAGAAPEPSLEPDATRALELYRDALVSDRPLEAFELIHPDAREGMDARAFQTLFERHKDALVEQAERLLATAKKAHARERAQVKTDKGVVELERTPEGWRLVAPVGSKVE